MKFSTLTTFAVLFFFFLVEVTSTRKCMKQLADHRAKVQTHVLYVNFEKTSLSALLSN